MSRIDGSLDAAASPVAAHIPAGIGESISLNEAERRRELALLEARRRPVAPVDERETLVRLREAEGMGSGDMVLGSASGEADRGGTSEGLLGGGELRSAIAMERCKGEDGPPGARENQLMPTRQCSDSTGGRGALGQQCIIVSQLNGMLQDAINESGADAFAGVARG